jgi:hypothetical protein
VGSTDGFRSADSNERQMTSATLCAHLARRVRLDGLDGFEGLDGFDGLPELDEDACSTGARTACHATDHVLKEVPELWRPTSLGSYTSNQRLSSCCKRAYRRCCRASRWRILGRHAVGVDGRPQRLQLHRLRDGHLQHV